VVLSVSSDVEQERAESDPLVHQPENYRNLPLEMLPCVKVARRHSVKPYFLHS
jgi:hypothetical protein